MKKKFSIKWRGSKQARKQRKFVANAPLHVKQKMMSSNLSKDLRKKYGKRSMPVRKSDKVKILSGEFRGKEGKIDIVNIKRMRVSLEGIQRKKIDGTKVNVWFFPSKLQITELNLDDKKRLRRLTEEKKEKAEKQKSKEGKKTESKNQNSKGEK